MTNLQLDKEKREKTQINKIRNERRDIITYATEIQRIIKGYYKQLYAIKIDNLEEMDKFLETYDLPRWSQEEIENLERSMMSKDIKSVSKNLPTQKTPEPDSFTGEFSLKF